MKGVALLLIVFLFVGLGFMKKNSNGSKSKTNLSVNRGIRNNNPLNIRKGNNWVGESESRDNEFETFSHHKYGFRAAAKLIRNYQKRYGLNTVSLIIGRWAPPNENDTGNYAQFVANQLKVGLNEPLDVRDNNKLAQLLHAMSIMEVGRHYTLNDAMRGVRLV